ncbi:MAG: NAD(P)H-binding protein [Streptosporangiaceae bacterium]|nr:NAD(P)H-binding protein [Streptosporangiaceae bacterium]MBV9854758.1 NAD(P)H-binding protein [Streptosporangiaceae bacterium]
MKLTVFGATGGTGAELIRQAIEAQHDVLAVVRDPARLRAAASPHLHVMTADVMQPAAIQDAVAGRDAVISALGSRNPRAKTTVCADSARSIVTAMRAAGSRRLLVVSGSGAVDAGDSALLRYVGKPAAKLFLKHQFADFRAMEDIVRGSGLNWTIVRPPRLNNRPFTARYQVRRDMNVRGSYVISRADLAAALLAFAADTGSYHAAFGVAR